MTQAEKLEALVRKAAQSGWKKGWDWLDTITGDDAPLFTSKMFLFDHDFARALFGEDATVPDGESGGSFNAQPGCFGPATRPGFKYHLQQAVVSDDPIDYLYQEAICKK